ncbi:MAG: hypothetical protein CSA34_00855 [Desulfobulbus propionicus]|nr:MAG: hypothetical protein CSA34_00855 [Desulfobulbus propionicus]
MSIYLLEGVKRIYGDSTVLDIDRLEIEEGAMYSLVGANGAGKTTLLDILGFLAPPDRGAMHFRGQPVRPNEKSLRDLRQQVVMLDQHPIMFSTSVRKNVEFGLKARGVSRRERDGIVDEVLEVVNMRAFKQRNAKRLSGGETQRLALARALALSPAVFLCDEPTASVDAENKAAINDLLRRINQERGITIIFTTHERFQASSLAEKTLVLERGRLVSSIYENVFTCEVEITGDVTCCTINDQVSLQVPAAMAPARPGEYRMFVDPTAIELVPRAQGDPGILRGRIALMMEVQEQVRITVDAGIPVTVLIPKEMYRLRRPCLGDAVALRIRGIRWAQ